MRAPASTANLGPGFDCAAAALDLWNELHVLPAADGEPLVTLEGEGADELPRDATHLALRAFALVAPLEGHRFRFVNRIPLERGLGSSRGDRRRRARRPGSPSPGATPRPTRLLELGAAARGPRRQPRRRRSRGGVCLIWRERRPATRSRAARRPTCRSRAIVVVPEHAREHEASRARACPSSLRHEEAAAAAAQAALLGAGDRLRRRRRCSPRAFHDRLHEPFRARRRAAARGAAREPGHRARPGVTLSGSGPSVVVWAEKDKAAAAAAELERALPDAASCRSPSPPTAATAREPPTGARMSVYTNPPIPPSATAPR